MKFNTSLPVRFKVLAQKSARLYELAICSRKERGKSFSLASRARLEIGATYMASAGDGTFSNLSMREEFAYLNAQASELLALACSPDYAQKLTQALLESANRAEYELLKFMLLRLASGEIYIAALDENVPIKIQITANKIRCEHYVLGICELSGDEFSAEFTCVQDLLLKFKNE